MAQLDHAILGFAIISSVLASGALLLSIRNQTSTAPATLVPTAESSTPKADEKAPDTSSDDESDDDKKDKDKEKAVLIDDAYKRIHQRYNRKDYKWEDFDPEKDAQTHEGVIFIVYHRHWDPTAIRPLERLVEVESESLKDVLRGCLKFIDTVFDPKPMV